MENSEFAENVEAGEERGEKGAEKGAEWVPVREWGQFGLEDVRLCEDEEKEGGFDGEDSVDEIFAQSRRGWGGELRGI